MDGTDELGDGETLWLVLSGHPVSSLGLIQGAYDLSFPSNLLRQFSRDLCPQVFNDCSVCGISELAVVGLHFPQCFHVCAHFLNCSASVSQYVVPCQHGIVLLHDKAHVVVGVAWGMYGADCRALNPEYLLVNDRLLVPVWGMFVDPVHQVWVEGD